jgi:hypothetical protein
VTVFLAIVSIVIWLALIWITARIALNKGRNVVGYAIFAAIVPVIALIVIALMPPKRTAGDI